METGDDTQINPDIERRDTSWVEGELATDFENFPNNGVKRVPIDSRYYLTTPDDFSRIIEETIIDHRRYKRAKFACENFAFGLQNVVAQRYGINSVGIVIDLSNSRGYNIVIYDDGMSEVFDPNNEMLVTTGRENTDHEAYEIESGLILL